MEGNQIEVRDLSKLLCNRQYDWVYNGLEKEALSEDQHDFLYLNIIMSMYTDANI